jgi:hypothetical protein
VTMSWTVGVRFPAEVRIILFVTTPILTLGPTRPFCHSVPGALFQRQSGRSVNLTTHQHPQSSSQTVDL